MAEGTLARLRARVQENHPPQSPPWYPLGEQEIGRLLDVAESAQAALSRFDHDVATSPELSQNGCTGPDYDNEEAARLRAALAALDAREGVPA